VTRDPDDGTITDLTYDAAAGQIDIRNTDRTVSKLLPHLDIGFSPGPDNFDYVSLFSAEEFALCTTWD
jgi:hypothetical protein